MKKRGELGSALIILAVVSLLLASAFTLLKGGITGYTVFPPPPECYNNFYACIDLTGDGAVTLADEEIFALVLNGTITKSKDPEIYNRSDWNKDGFVTNAVDFQQCFVYFRDQAKDRYNGSVKCNPPQDNLTNRTNLSACYGGCSDLNGDGYVNQDDYTILRGILIGDINESIYPMADLTEDGQIDWADRDCFSAFEGKIVTCNLPTHAFHKNSCPDLTDDANTGNDGFVDSIDLNLFNQYEAEQNLKADFSGDGEVNGLDRLIFEEYYGDVVDCDIYHAPWHIGGIDQNNSDTTYNNQVSIGGSVFASQSFTTSREGQLAKIRLYMNYSYPAVQAKDILVRIYPNNSTNHPNMSVLIDSAVIEAFAINYSHWETAYFRVPPLLKNNTKYHIVLSVPNSSAATYMWITNPNNYPGGQTLSSVNSGASWIAPLIAGDAIFEVFTSTACADINSDGVCDGDDTAIIDKIPDGLNASGVGTYNSSFDLNDDHVINEEDYNLVDDAIGSSGYLEKPVLDINNSEITGSRTIGDANYLAQSFTAANIKLSKISLYLASNSISKRNITLELRTDSAGEPGSLVDSTEIKGFDNHSFRWYDFVFDETVDLIIDDIYHIVISATDTSVPKAYNWSNGTSYANGEGSKSVNYGSSWTNISDDFAFALYSGDSRWNDSYDFNNDDLINDEDLTLMANLIGSHDGTLWTPLVDFNAIFGVFERLLDKVLGFEAYLGKVLKCGFDTWTIGCNNTRCDKGENFSICPNDCPACNEDDFCAVSEDFNTCSDCVFWKALPNFDKFNGDTTPFYSLSLSQLQSVSNMVLEILPYGKITFLEPINVTSLDLDSYVDIFFNNVSVDVTALPELNKSAYITLYNLSHIYPNIILNGAVCPEYVCTFTSYGGGDLTFYITGFSWYSTEEIGPNTTTFNGSTTDFSIINYPQMENITNVPNVILERANYGKIRFLEPINVKNADFDSHIKMGHTWISINLTGLPNLVNKSAELSFYNINFTYPIILEDGIRCKDNCSFVSYQNGIFVVDVSLNSNYSVDEAAPDVETFNGTNTTNFSINYITKIVGDDIENVSDMTLEKPAGKIVFLELINATKGEYDADVEISLNGGSVGGGWVFVNTTHDSRLNKSALIYLYNLSLYKPIIRNEDFSDCTDCVILHYDGSPLVEGQKKCNNNCTLVFNVSHFTKYYAMENSNGAQPIDGPIPNIVMKENSIYSVNLSRYFFDVDNDSKTLIYNNSPIIPATSKIKINYVNDTAYINASQGSIGVYATNFSAWDGNISYPAAYSNRFYIIVKPNAPPQVNGTIPTQVWDEDDNITINLTKYLYDPDNDSLTYGFTCIQNCTGVNVTNISIIINQTTGIATLVPNPNFFGIRWVKFKASDGYYSVSSTRTELRVTSINDKPYIREEVNDTKFQYGEFLNIIINEDNFTWLYLPNYIADVEDDSEDLDYSLFNYNPITSNFNVTFDTNGNATFKPRGNWSGFEDFIIKITDKDNGINYTNEFTIYVTPDQDPVYRTSKIFNLTWDEDTTLPVNLSDYFVDVDGDVVYYANPQYGNITISINFLTGEINLTPNPDWFGTKYVNLSATDILSTLWNYTILNVTNINDAPELVKIIPNQTWDEDNNIIINLTAYLVDKDFEVDPNLDAIKFNHSAVDNITILINQSTGITVLIPDPHWYGVRNVVFNVTDIENATAASNVVKLNVTSVNDVPILSLVDMFAFVNKTLSYQIPAVDYDGDALAYNLLTSYPGMNLASNGSLTWTPGTNYSGQNNVVNLTVSDSINTTFGSFGIYICGASYIVNSTIDSNFKNGVFYEIDTICESNITISTISNSEIWLSKVDNSTLSNSNIFNCTVTDSDLADANCENGIIDPSNITNSSTTGSVINNCTLINSNFVDSYCENSVIIGLNLTNVNITNGIIYSGAITMYNGTIYNASVSPPENLTDLVNYPPSAVIVVSNTTAYTGDIITFNGLSSTDPNIGSALNDTIVNYTWEFGDGTNATNGSVVNHSYSTAGTKYVKLTVTDKYNASDKTTQEITISSKYVSKVRGGGGRGAQTISIQLSTIPLTRTLYYRDRLVFVYENISHMIQILAIYADNVLLGISSPVVAFNLIIPYNQASKIDITGDNIADIEIIVSKLASNRVSLTIKELEKAAESCYDGILNQDETDVDCGGICTACPDGRYCLNDDDCINMCNINTSRCYTPAPLVQEGTCNDGIRNQGETGVDCGGPCAPCFIKPTTEAPTEAKSYLWLYIVLVIVIIVGSAGAAAYYWFEISSKRLEFETKPKIKPVERKPKPAFDVRYLAKQKLTEYVTSTLEKGYSESKIRNKLKNINWPDSMVNEVFRELK